MGKWEATLHQSKPRGRLAEVAHAQLAVSGMFWGQQPPLSVSQMQPSALSQPHNMQAHIHCNDVALGSSCDQRTCPCPRQAQRWWHVRWEVLQRFRGQSYDAGLVYRCLCRLRIWELDHGVFDHYWAGDVGGHGADKFGRFRDFAPYAHLPLLCSLLL